MAKKKKAGRPRLSGGAEVVSLRVEREVLARAEALAALVDADARSAVDVTRYAEGVSRATILRHALLVGLAALEKQKRSAR